MLNPFGIIRSVTPAVPDVKILIIISASLATIVASAAVPGLAKFVI